MMLIRFPRKIAGLTLRFELKKEGLLMRQPHCMLWRRKLRTRHVLEHGKHRHETAEHPVAVRIAEVSAQKFLMFCSAAAKTERYGKVLGKDKNR
jgi:hypothetical protein